jgi:5-methylcytosine-specific restriction endonuclease McrA
MVFVLDTNMKQLAPCHQARARKLLKMGKAAVFRLQPFSIILKREVKDVIKKNCQIKIDPGSKVTGIALLNKEGKVVWCCEIHHRGGQIKKKLESRKALRRGRRSRLRYRKPRFKTKGQIRNAKRHFKNRKGKLPPSVQHRVENIITWTKRVMKFAPVSDIVLELVRFDMQKIENKNISGIEYQQGELQGFEVKEYLLEKYKRTCVYCGRKNIPLEVEHVIPKSKGGSNRVSNLVIACVRCNKRKGNKSVQDFLKSKPVVLRRVSEGLKKPLKDASAVNASRWVLYQKLNKLCANVHTGSGGRTKFNRKRFKVSKSHQGDAACVGKMSSLFIPKGIRPLVVKSTGQGGRQKAMCDKYGYPKSYRPLKPLFGWRTGDIAKCSGKLGRVTPRSNKSFGFAPLDGSKKFSRNERFFTKKHRMDGYVVIVA